MTISKQWLANNAEPRKTKIIIEKGFNEYRIRQ